MGEFVSQLTGITIDLVPFFIGIFAIRRFFMSRSFNRLIYGAMVLHCVLLIGANARYASDPRMPDAVIDGLLLVPLVFWLYIIVTAPSLRGEAEYEISARGVARR